MARPMLVVTCAVVAGAIAGATIALVARDHSSATSTVGSGVAASQTRTLPPFSAVELAGSNNVVIRVGAAQAVVVHADANLLRRVTTAVRDSTLEIGDLPGSYRTKSPMSVDVTVPSLTRVAVSGSGNVTASGSTPRLEAVLSGSGNLFLAELHAPAVRAQLTGSGTIRVTATATLDVRLSGSGAVFYGGHPSHVTSAITGSGVVLQN